MHAYLREAPDISAPEDHHDERRGDERAAQRPAANLPRLLALARARVDAHHQENDVGRGHDVEGLEDDVPRPMEGLWVVRLP